MKRSPMPPASKPMTRGTPLARTPFPARASGLGRGAGLARPSVPRVTPCPEKAAAKPKRVPAGPEEKRARDIVKVRAGGRCEGCGVVGRTDWSHRIGRAVGGPWCPSNGLALCRLTCHAHVGENPTAARDGRGWRLRSTDNPAELPALHAVHGWVLLDVDGGMVPVDAEDARQALAA